MTLEEIVNNLKSEDYGQLFNNNPRMDATKQFGGRAINNINSAGEGYSQWQRLQDQNFGPNQSVIASGFMHPQKGLSKLADWFTNNVNTAAGLPDPNQQDEASMYAYGPNIDQQAESGLNLAGLLQTGAFASGAAPKSAGGTLGTFIGRNSTGWDATKAAEAEKLLNAGVDPVQVWKEHLIGRMPDGNLFSEIDDSVAKYLNKSELKSIDGKIIHDNLFNEYPDLKNINFEKITDNSAKASYQPDSYDPWGTHLPEEIGINEKRRSTNKDKLSNISHELQHGVQYREDFPVGGNLRIASDIINEKNHKIHSDVEEILGVYGYKDPRIKELLSKKLDPRNNDNLMSVYRRLTGEAQARATQDRIDMNMQQRRDNYPLAGDKLSDIPLDQLINRYGDNGPSMSMSIKNPNLNFELLNKHLSGQKLTPEEMALYEKNGSAMETPQLQRYNLGNANAQGGSPESRSKYLYDSLHGGREFKKYDGTTGSAINGFDLSKGGMGSGNRDGKLGVFSTNDPFVASEFAERRNNPFVMPLKIRMDNPWKPDNYQEISGLIDNHTQFKDSYKFPDGSNIRMVDDVINPEAARKELTDKGFDSVYLKNTTMDSIDKKPINQYVSLDPKNIRSRFAAFDPLRKNSSSLLASGLLGSLLLKQMNQESSQQ